ncbi:hypothetical protein ACFL59_12040 [Planctomycetota bacterium]
MDVLSLRSWFLLVCSLPLCSCAHFFQSDYKLDRRLAKPLPALKIEFDEQSVRDSLWHYREEYADTRTSQSALGRETTSRIVDAVRRDPAIGDVKEILRRELKRFAFREGGRSAPDDCSLVVRIAGTKHDVDSDGYFLPGILTLGLVYLLGFPAACEEATVGLVILVKRGEETVGRYTGLGERTRWSACYWGYYPSSLHRAAMASATLAALEDAMGRLEKDANRLRRRLSARRVTRPVRNTSGAR